MLTAEETLQFQKKVTRPHTHNSVTNKCECVCCVQVKSVDVEEELEKTLRELDIDHWVNKRVPRPPGWED